MGCAQTGTGKTAAFALPMTVVILLGTGASLLLVLHGIFAVPMKGSLLLFFAVTTLYTFTTAGLGLYISTISRNLAQATMLVILVLMPMLFLSGAWTPPEADLRPTILTKEQQ